MAEFLERLAICIFATGFYFAAGARMFGVMQQCGYKNARFYAWLKRRDNLWYNRLCLFFLILLLSCTLTAVCFSFLGAAWARLLSLIPFACFAAAFCAAEGKAPLKVPLARTGRIKRLGGVYALLLAVAIYLLIDGFVLLEHLVTAPLFTAFSVVPLCFVPLLLPFIFALSNAVSCAFENPRNARYVKKNAEKIRASSAIKIGVTGSYGKTSVKNILATILSEKYKVVSTPESYNTPIGIAKAADLPEFASAEVFIAEMGARKAGDIEELCAMVCPDYGVFTGVCRQHAETFGSEENIFDEKKKLVDSVKQKCVCGADLYEKYGDKFSAEEMKKIVFVPRGAVINLGGAPFRTDFDLTLTMKNGESETRRVQIPLLGKGSAENVALAAYLAAEMGLGADEIFRGIEKILPVPHRLNLMKENGVYILDDGYNASEKSAEQALDVLSAFPGKKYVVTPGIVETGIEDAEVNRPLGARLAKFDGVFVANGASAVKEGYLCAGGNEDTLHVFSDEEEVKAALSEVLCEGDAVLFLNDLPDVY